MSSWYVYLLRCADSSLYTGITVNVERRFKEHCSSKRGAKYLRGRGPLRLVFQCAVSDRSHASKLELLIKQLSKQDKENLLTDRRLLDSLLQQIESCGPVEDLSKG